ncbi:MAG TPA: glycine oxidase ThiO [Longimicrobiales bacterium]
MIEVVVIGGGIAGCAAALALRERGVAVNLVEAIAPGACATGASAGMLAPQYESAGPSALFDLSIAARAYYPTFVERIEALTGQRLPIRWDGMLVAHLTEREHEAGLEASRWQRAAGQEAEVLEPAEAARIEPHVNPKAISYLWLPREGQVDSQALGPALGAALAAAGVRVVAGKRAARIEVRSGAVEAVVLEDGRTLTADCVVVAAGAWSGTIAGLPRPLPVRPIRGEILKFSPAPARLGPLVAGHRGNYLVPRANGGLIAGSTMDDVGFDQSLTEQGRQKIADGAAALVPALAAAKPAEHWAGLRPITRDRFPILGLEPEIRGLVYATGYGRNGILLGPLAGEIVADLILDGTARHDIRAFAPDRFPAEG